MTTSRFAGAGWIPLVLAVALMIPSQAWAQGEGEIGPAIGSAGPSAALEDLDGNAVDLLDYVDGKPAVFEFWATWCEICEALQPQMDEIQRRFGDRVSVIAVAVGVAQSQRRVKRHLEEHDPGYPYLWDAGGRAVRAYAAPTTGVVVMLDGDGKVAYTGVGADQDLIGAVEALLGGN